MGKKVVLIGHKCIPSRQGGVEVVVDRLAIGLAGRGYTVEAYNRKQHSVFDPARKDDYGHGDKKMYGKVRIREIPTLKSSGYNAMIYTFLATIRSMFGGYDIYHFHAEGPCAMLWLPHMFRKRIIVTIHGLDWQRAKWGRMASGVIKLGERQAVKYASEIIVLSENVRDYFREAYGRKTIYLPNGADCPKPVEPDLIKEKYGLDSGSYILFVARIVPEKGVHYLIDAFKNVNTDKKLVIAGGSGQTEDYMEHVRKLAVKDHRIIMTGFVQGRLLDELYSNAYMYVLPSDVEGMALTLLEAASYGNCCLVSDIPENTEVMGDACETFKAGDTEDLQDKLEQLIGDTARTHDLGSKAAEMIKNSHSWDRIIDRTVEIYEGTYSK